VNAMKADTVLGGAAIREGQILNGPSPAFSKLKAHLRKAAEHTIPRLLRRIGRVVTDFSAQECGNFFAMRAIFEPDRNPL